MTAFNLFKKETKPKAKKKAPVQSEAPAVVETPATAPVSSNRSVLLHFYVSEKASMLEGARQYVFKVATTANKPEVKKAVQNQYNVKVTAVRMINMPSKTRNLGRRVGTKAGFRKAVVTLAEGDSINSAKS